MAIPSPPQLSTWFMNDPFFVMTCPSQCSNLASYQGLQCTLLWNVGLHFNSLKDVFAKKKLHTLIEMLHIILRKHYIESLAYMEITITILCNCVLSGVVTVTMGFVLFRIIFVSQKIILYISMYHGFQSLQKGAVYKREWCQIGSEHISVGHLNILIITPLVFSLHKYPP